MCAAALVGALTASAASACAGGDAAAGDPGGSGAEDVLPVTATPTADSVVVPTAAPTVEPTLAPTPTAAPTATATPEPTPTLAPLSDEEFEVASEAAEADVDAIIEVHTRVMTELFAQDERTAGGVTSCLLYTSPSPRDGLLSRMPSSA